MTEGVASHPERGGYAGGAVRQGGHYGCAHILQRENPVWRAALACCGCSRPQSGNRCRIDLAHRHGPSVRYGGRRIRAAWSRGTHSALSAVGTCHLWLSLPNSSSGRNRVAESPLNASRKSDMLVMVGWSEEQASQAAAPADASGKALGGEHLTATVMGVLLFKAVSAAA